jgi:hypothetical protein
MYPAWQPTAHGGLPALFSEVLVVTYKIVTIGDSNQGMLQVRCIARLRFEMAGDSDMVERILNPDCRTGSKNLLHVAQDVIERERISGID